VGIGSDAKPESLYKDRMKERQKEDIRRRKKNGTEENKRRPEKGSIRSVFFHDCDVVI